MDPLDLIRRTQAARAAQGLHVHWRLPDGSEWSAFAASEQSKSEWIAAKAKQGWVYLPELDFTFTA
jgi:hypothetical protein